MQEDHFCDLKRIYSAFASSHSNQKREFNESKRNVECIKKFFKHLENDGAQCDRLFLFNYTFYQFARVKMAYELSGGQYYSKFGNAAIMVSWVYGKKAYKKWKDRDRANWKERAQKFHKPIDYDSIFGEDEMSIDDDALTDTELEDLDRGRFFSTNKRFYACFSLTSMADPESEFCPKCPLLKMCKEIQRKVNQKTYISRWQKPN